MSVQLLPLLYIPLKNVLSLQSNECAITIIIYSFKECFKFTVL